VLEHKSFIEKKFSDTGRRRTKEDVTREHNSSFTCWFKEKLLQLHHGNMPSMEKKKLLFVLSQGHAMNVRTYQAYDINGYTFYTEKKNYHPVGCATHKPIIGVKWFARPRSLSSLPHSPEP
jgi:hypothetical protein